MTGVLRTAASAILNMLGPKVADELGSEYYTLTYESDAGNADGKFRRVRVTLRDPALRAVTKAGYFAPNEGTPVHPRKQKMIDISEAVRSTIPFPALALTIEDSRTASGHGQGRVYGRAEVRKHRLATSGQWKEHGGSYSRSGEPHPTRRCSGVEGGNCHGLDGLPRCSAASRSDDANAHETTRSAQDSERASGGCRLRKMGGSARWISTAKPWRRRPRLPHRSQSCFRGRQIDDLIL